jgi:hypothetical protein
MSGVPEPVQTGINAAPAVTTNRHVLFDRPDGRRCRHGMHLPWNIPRELPAPVDQTIFEFANVIEAVGPNSPAAQFSGTTNPWIFFNLSR